jgi:hypothetical protein
MELSVDDVEYHVLFEHYPYEEHQWGTGSTECRIIWVPKQSRFGEQYVIWEATHCSSSDKFNERDGRRHSFEKAVSHFKRPIRKAFWEVYEQTYGIP